MTTNMTEKYAPTDPAVDFPAYALSLIKKGQELGQYKDVDMADDQILTAKENHLNFMEIRTFWDRMSALDEIRQQVTPEDVELAQRLGEFHETAKRGLAGDRRPGDEKINGIDQTAGGGHPKWLYDLGDYTLNRVYEVRDLLPQFQMLDKVRSLDLVPKS